VNPDACFAPDYRTARDRFRAAAAAAGWTLRADAVQGIGPAGEALTIDTASGPDPGTGRTLIVSSGIHGVEGPFGSAVQLALLERWQKRPPQARAVLIHALNPFGYAWRRRTDDRNVDLNRNFLLPGERFAGAPPGYAQLDPLLNPRRPPSDREIFLLKALPALARYGPAALRRAIAVGQYDFASGLFYGGASPAPTRRAIETVLEAAVHGSSDVVHLDLHTGLGRSAVANVLIDYALTGRQRTDLVRMFGRDGFRTADVHPAVYAARGSLAQWCAAARLTPAYLFGFVEVGTYAGARVLAALRAENQAHHFAGADAAATMRAKARLEEAFCPRDAAWRARALAACLAVVDRASGDRVPGDAKNTRPR
jgi:hypothetical protein